MAMTTLGDLFAGNTTASYAVIQSYMDEIGDMMNDTPFMSAGILTSNAVVSALASGNTAGGPEIVMPYFGRIATDVEPNVSNDVYEDVAIPHKIDTGSMKARVAFLNEAWGSMDLVTEVTGTDPLRRIAQFIPRYWQEEAELRLLATLRGLYADAAAMSTNDMNVAVTATGSVNEGILDGMATMGDNFGAIAGIVTDSRTYFRAVKEDIADKQTTRDGGLTRGTLWGLPAIISDKAMRGVSGNSIITLLGRNAFAYGMAEPKVPLAYEREEARGNGGGAETLWTRRNIIMHPMGYSFTSTSITGNGTETVARGAGWTDLANAANWERTGPRKAVPIAFVTVATKT